MTNRDYYRELTEERKIVVSDEDIKLAESLNTEQMEGFNEIFDHVIRNKEKVFFADGPGLARHIFTGLFWPKFDLRTVSQWLQLHPVLQHPSCLAVVRLIRGSKFP